MSFPIARWQWDLFFLAQVGIAEFLVGVSSSQVTALNQCQSITVHPIRVASDRSWWCLWWVPPGPCCVSLCFHVSTFELQCNAKLICYNSWIPCVFLWFYVFLQDTCSVQMTRNSMRLYRFSTKHLASKVGALPSQWASQENQTQLLFVFISEGNWNHVFAIGNQFADGRELKENIVCSSMIVYHEFAEL